MKENTKPTQEEKAFAYQLMIGNFIKVNRFDIDIPATIENFYDIHQISTGQLKVKGEPLTEDWLEKFGFEGNEDERHIVLGLGGGEELSVELLTKTCCLTRSKKNELDDFVYVKYPEYVHQLQNLYYTLTGLRLRQKGG